MKAAWKINLVCLTLLISAAVPPDSPVADAAMRGDAEDVRELLRAGADVNAAQGDGMTALHWAAENGQIELADVLVFAGANLEAATRLGGFTPLMVASRAGHADIVRMLADAGANLEATTETGETALHYAAWSGNPEIAVALAEKGADVDAQESANGQTPLMFAAAYGRTDVVRSLLGAGADPSIQTHVIDYPAMAREDRELIKQRDRRLSALFGEDIISDTPVDGTRQDDDEEEAEEEEEERRPAGRAATRGQTRAPMSYDQLVGRQGGNNRAALRGPRGPPRRRQDPPGRRRRHRPGYRRRPEFGPAHDDPERALRPSRCGCSTQGADPNLQSDPGATPLYAAVHLQWVPKSFYPQPTAIKQENTTYLELMKALLDAGAEPNVRLKRHLWYTSFNHNVLGVDTWGATPFWRAAYGTDVDAMRLLVAYGANYTTPTFRPPGRPSTGNGRDDGEKKPDPSGAARGADRRSGRAAHPRGLRRRLWPRSGRECPSPRPERLAPVGALPGRGTGGRT